MPRPRSFDDETAVDAALNCFWGRGYEATSIRDLCAAMGISTPSLYNAFGDKRELYVEALEHYCRTRTHPLLERIEREHRGAAAMVAFFGEVVERTVNDRDRKGCFLINSALEVAPHDRVMAKVVTAHLDAIRAFLKRLLEAAAALGELEQPNDLDSTADQLVSVLLGIRVLARARPERDLLVRIVRSTLLSIGLAEDLLGAFRPQSQGPRRTRNPQ